MKNDKLRVGVVGLMVGGRHVADYLASGFVEDIVICDANRDKLDDVGNRLGIKKRYTDFEEMLLKEKLDAVSIAVPNKLHMPLTIRALEAGCHVLCEKPMARNAEEAEKMLFAAKQTGKKLMINFNQRFDPYYQALKSMIEEGKLGDIYFCRTLWHRRRGVPWWYPLAQGKELCGGGPLIDLGVHVLDRAMWWCGFPKPEWVLGNTFCKTSDADARKHGMPGFPLEDFGVAMIRMQNGAMMELEASWSSNCEKEVITTQLYGSKGGSIIHRVVGDESATKNELYLEIDGRQCNLNLVPNLLPSVPNIREAFLESIITNTEVPCTPEQGLLISKILDAVYKSAETHAPVKIA